MTKYSNWFNSTSFQHTAARRRLETQKADQIGRHGFNTQPPEGGWTTKTGNDGSAAKVSTHSRPKAAGFLPLKEQALRKFQHTAARRRLAQKLRRLKSDFKFQHTAARRRLASNSSRLLLAGLFQHTAARRRLDGFHGASFRQARFNTQPPEGGWIFGRFPLRRYSVSTHSRPKAAGMYMLLKPGHTAVSTHSRPKAAGSVFLVAGSNAMFQHTAARRRLECHHLDE